MPVHNDPGFLDRFSGQFPELLEDNWLDLVRVFDAFEQPETFLILPPMESPYHFKWRIFVEPAGMAPMITNEVAKTPMVTQKAVYEYFECKYVKEGFYLTEKEMDFGLKQVLPQMMRQVIGEVNRRIEYVNLEALFGNTWNTQFTGRQVGLTRLTWQANGGTPIRDILTMMLRVWKLSGQTPAFLWLGPDEYFFLQDHSTILQYKGMGSGMREPNDLLCHDMINCIKTLTVKRVNGFYKESATDYALQTAGTPEVGQPGFGDVDMDLFATPNKHWFLQDRALVTTANVGNTGCPKGTQLETRQWEDEDTGQLYWKFGRYFTPVIGDYARVGKIDFTQTLRDAYGEPTVL